MMNCFISKFIFLRNFSEINAVSQKVQIIFNVPNLFWWIMVQKGCGNFCSHHLNMKYPFHHTLMSMEYKS